MEGESVTVETKDGPFQVLKGDAVRSKTLKDLMDDAPAGGVIPLHDIDGTTLRRVITWLQTHKDDPEVAALPTDNAPGAAQKQDLTDADKEFFASIDQHAIFQLILAANYLDIRKLLDMCCRAVANSVLGKTPKEIYAYFGVTKELTPEEEEQVRADNPWLEDN